MSTLRCNQYLRLKATLRLIGLFLDTWLRCLHMRRQPAHKLLLYLVLYYLDRVLILFLLLINDSLHLRVRNANSFVFFFVNELATVS